MYQQTSFGDNYGRSRVFNKPNDDDDEEVKYTSFNQKSNLMSNPLSKSTGTGYGYVPVGLRNIGNTCFMNSIV